MSAKVRSSMRSRIPAVKAAEDKNPKTMFVKKSPVVVVKKESAAKPNKMQSAKTALKMKLTAAPPPTPEELEIFQQNLLLDNCTGFISTPNWTIEKTADSSECSGDGTATADFTVTITRPTGDASVCFASHFTITNTTDSQLQLTAAAQLKLDGVTVQDFQITTIEKPPSTGSIDAQGLITLAAGESVTGIVSGCRPIICPEEGVTAEYTVGLLVNIFAVFGTDPLIIPVKSLCNCPIIDVTANNCKGPCYFLTESSTCGADTNTDAVQITALNFDETNCEDLSIVKEDTHYNLFPLDTDEPIIRPSEDTDNTNAILICPDCFGDTNTIVLNITVTCTGFTSGDEITNTACITKAIEKCGVLTPSDRPCDQYCASASITPQLCCSIESTNLTICICKTSEVVQQPSSCGIRSQGYYFAPHGPNPDPNSGREIVLRTFANTIFTFYRIGQDTYPYCDNLTADSNILPVLVPEPANGPTTCKLTINQVLALFRPQRNDVEKLAIKFFTAGFNIFFQESCARPLLTTNPELLGCLCETYKAITDALIDANCVVANATIDPNTASELKSCLEPLTKHSEDSETCVPAVIHYDITPTVTGGDTCIRFAIINFNPELEYTYEVYLLSGGERVGDAASGGIIVPCTATSCETTDPSCFITVCFTYAQLLAANADQINVIVTSSQGGDTQCTEDIPHVALSLGECLTFCVYEDGVLVDGDCDTCSIDLTDEDAIRAAVALTNPGDEDNTTTLTDLLVTLLLNKCHIVPFENNETDNDQIRRFLDPVTGGLHFDLTLGSDCSCCGKCVVVTNKFSVEVGDNNDCDNSDCVECIPGLHTSRTDAQVRNGIQFPDCAPEDVAETTEKQVKAVKKVKKLNKVKVSRKSNKTHKKTTKKH